MTTATTKDTLRELLTSITDRSGDHVRFIPEGRPGCLGAEILQVMSPKQLDLPAILIQSAGRIEVCPRIGADGRPDWLFTIEIEDTRDE